MLAVKFNESLSKTILVLALLLLDSIVLYWSFFISVKIRLNILPQLFNFFPGDFPPTHTASLWWILVICLGCLVYGGLYSKRLPFWPETRNLFVALTLAFILIMAVVSLGKLGGYVSRTSIVASYLLALIIMPLVRYGGKSLLFRMGIGREKVLILGFNQMGKQIAAAIKDDKYLGYEQAGFLTFAPQEGLGNKADSQILGGLEQAGQIMGNHRIKHIIVAAPHLAGPELVKLSNSLQSYASSIMVVPDLFGLPVTNSETGYFFDEQILALRVKNNLASPINIIIKRIFDLIMALLLLLPLTLLALLLALLIKIDSTGPVFYSGERVGRRGDLFKCYKFRTMYIDNEQILQEHLQNDVEAQEEWQQFKKLRNGDPRITKLGGFLRKTSLDELPQIINVIKGEMSLVGARPYLLEEREAMKGYDDTILLASPGITGLWQVSGRNEIDFAGRLIMETWYVRNWSLWLDVSLLFRTVSVVLSSKGAY